MPPVWIINNQLGRRNLQDFQKVELVSLRKNILLGKGRQIRQYNLKRGPEVLTNNNSGKYNTRETLAHEAGVSPGRYAQAEQIIKNGSDELKQELRNGTKKIGEAGIRHPRCWAFIVHPAGSLPLGGHSGSALIFSP